MKRTILIKVTVGEHSDETFEATELGCWSTPTEHDEKKAELSTEDFNAYVQHLWKLHGEGVYVEGIGRFIRGGTLTLSKEGSHHQEYINLCVSKDKYNKEIMVDDTMYASIKNAVEVVTVLKIADTPYHAGYGCIHRKIKVKREDGTVMTINDSSTCIKR
jgi:hypothetical protein